MPDGTKKDWRELCLAVANERDQTKLSSLVRELIEELDRGERSWRHPSSGRMTQWTHIGKKVELGQHA